MTSAYGAMSLIKNFQEEQAARVLSSETRNTLHQWHRRRTAQRSTPSVDDFQVTHLPHTIHDSGRNCRPGSNFIVCAWKCFVFMKSTHRLTSLLMQMFLDAKKKALKECRCLTN